jgi:hypothetical protein
MCAEFYPHATSFRWGGLAKAVRQASPRLGLKADVISGDGNLNDNRLETFNPLFPKLPYFNEANNIAPSNLLDLQPNVTLTFANNLTANVAWNPLWKQREADAFYAPPLTPVNGTSGSAGRFIGQQVSALLEWQATEHLSVAATYVHFTPGNALKQASRPRRRFRGSLGAIPLLNQVLEGRDRCACLDGFEHEWLTKQAVAGFAHEIRCGPEPAVICAECASRQFKRSHNAFVANGLPGRGEADDGADDDGADSF